MTVSIWGRFFGLMLVFLLVQQLYLALVNRELFTRRLYLAAGTEKWDWAWLTGFKAAFLAVPVMASADVRSGAASLASWTELAGFGLFSLGVALFLWAMGANPFFEGTVRIQSERGHRPIDTGPYRFVRHPGYVGIIMIVLSFPPILTSARAFIAAGFAVALILVRTALEDRTLRVKLAGYSDYATRIRFRLIPGVW